MNRIYATGTPRTRDNARSKQYQLVAEARRRFGRIRPCRTRSRVIDCFELLDDRLYLWFDTADGATHLLGEGSLAKPSRA